MASILSACLVLYHCGDELTHALRCIQNADVDVDVYLVDNTPDDPTAEKAEWLFPGVTVLPQKSNIGFGRANNAVLPHLQSKYHLIMNPDVTFEPSLLNRMIMYMEAHPNIAILTPRVLNEDGTEQYLPKKRISVHYLLGGLLKTTANFSADGVQTSPWRTWTSAILSPLSSPPVVSCSSVPRSSRSWKVSIPVSSFTRRIPT